MNRKMTALRLHDGTVMYAKSFYIDDDIWVLQNVRVTGLPERIEEFKLHEDAIKVFFHVLEGGLNEEISES